MPEGYTRDMSNEPVKKDEKSIKEEKGETTTTNSADTTATTAGKVEQLTTKPEEKKEEVKTEEKKEEVKVEEKKEEEVKEPEKKKEVGEKVPVSVRDRIDRMYARLQAERAKSISAQDALAKVKKISETEEEEEEEKPRGMTITEAEAVWDRKEKEKRFKESETRVLMRHPDALNEDGSFNMNSEFTKKYIETGRKNPMLAWMENGPELAEATVERELGSSYKQGKKDEADRVRNLEDAHTSTSTVAVSATEVVKISDVEAKIARRMGITNKEYLAEKEKISKGQRSI